MALLAKFPLMQAAMLAAALSAALPAFAAAAPAPAFAGNAAGGRFMVIGGLTSQPVGHYDFCRRYARQCRARAAATPLALNAQSRRLLEQVNLGVNHQVAAATDLEIYGKPEYWEYPDKAGGRGDCEDYALLKQRELEQAGIAGANLLITVVRKPNGEAHAVLTARTDKGDYILDNLSDAMRLWRDTDYRYIKRQAADNAGLWAEIAPPPGAPVAMAARRDNAAGLGATQAIAAPVPAPKPGR